MQINLSPEVTIAIYFTIPKTISPLPSESGNSPQRKNPHPVGRRNLYLGVMILLTFLGPTTQNKKHIKEKRGRAKIIAKL